MLEDRDAVRLVGKRKFGVKAAALMMLGCGSAGNHLRVAKKVF